MLASLSASGQGAPIGQFDGHGDVGAPKIAGSAAYNAVSQEYSLSAGGVNMWAQKDEFQFVWKRMTGDFILQARIELVGKGVDPHRKAGLMVRPSQDADAPYVDGVVHGDGLTSLQFRRTKGAITEQVESAAKGADVIQIERKGQTYIFSAAKFGEPFTTSEISNVSLGDEVLVGLALCSHNADVTERAIFKDVRLVRPVKDGFVPYRRLHRQRARNPRRAERTEAGHLSVRAALRGARTGRPTAARSSTTRAARRASGADASFASTCSRASRRSSTPAPTTETTTTTCCPSTARCSASATRARPKTGSTIFTVPVGGGTPKRITQLAPSYLHGWSPDGKSLVYTGGRSGEFDIYSIASDGSGAEVNLTNSKGLDDGPEYSPDGKYIYFNSARSGLMQIWRMQPDGKNQEQITSDEYNNWFPHISPDGQWIAFISFPKEIDPTDHPYYKRVYLRLMPIGGGTPKVIAYVYGGQGTINVPSWSPDSRMVAFVSNTDVIK